MDTSPTLKEVTDIIINHIRLQNLISKKKKEQKLKELYISILLELQNSSIGQWIHLKTSWKPAVSVHH